MSVDFGEDRLRERGSLPVKFYVLTRVIVSMTNDNCRKFKHNQIILCIRSWIVKNWRPVSYTHLDVYKRQILWCIHYMSSNSYHYSVFMRYEIEKVRFIFSARKPIRWIMNISVYSLEHTNIIFDVSKIIYTEELNIQSGVLKLIDRKQNIYV